MNNRQNIINIIKLDADQDLMSELNYHLRTEHEESYDLADAICDLEEIAESEKDFAMLRKTRAIIVKAGGYIEMPIKTETGRDTRFIFNKKKYGWPHAGGWITWIDEEAVK